MVSVGLVPTRHLRNFNASQNAGLLAAVSDRALIIAAALDESFAHDGTSPHRTRDNSRLAVLGLCLSKHAVLAATPELTSNENTDSQVQIGGDQISSGSDGPVMVGSQVVGKYTSQGVLAYGGQDLGASCRGTIDDNDHPQAFWLFSVNACGAYGFGDLTVFHAGGTEPVGEVTLSSNSKVLKVDKGSGMLLLVGGGGPVETQARTASSRASSRTQGQ